MWEEEGWMRRRWRGRGGNRRALQSKLSETRPVRCLIKKNLKGRENDGVLELLTESLGTLI